MDVDRLVLVVAHRRERLHAVDELHDAVGLVADQPRQGAILVLDGSFEQLGGPADAREWVLDLVSQHGGQRRN